MLSNCGRDERGKYTNGVAGDQTGREWEIVGYFTYNWNVVLRHPNANVRKKIAELARKTANNNKVGYDQNQRLTFWTQLQASKYDPSKITVACEADCSSGVAAIVKAVGYLLGDTKLQNVNPSAYTGNLRNALKNAGFDVLTESKYLNSDAYLYSGDVLLCEGSHTAINLDDGSKMVKKPTSTPKVKIDYAMCHNKSVAATYRTTTALNLRSGAGTSKKIVTVIPSGGQVTCYGYYTPVNGTKWLLVSHKTYTGFVSSKYLVKI